MTARTAASAPRSHLRLVVLVLAAFVAGLAAAGQLAHRSTAASAPSGRPARTTGALTEPSPPAPGPTKRIDGAPAGFAHNEQGAVAAASSFVTTGQAMLDTDPLAAEKAVRQMAAEATADAQVENLLRQLAAVRETLAPGSGPVVYRQAALAWRLDGYTPDRARVAVWNVGVLSREGVAPPQAGWAVSSFDLVWERGDWRIWAETISPGPVPLPDDSAAPTTSAQLAAALDGFTDIGIHR